MIKPVKIALPHYKRVFAIAIFSIGIISFYVTAMGLNSFSFTRYPWLGFLAAFAIQVFLVAMHLKLPKILKTDVKDLGISKRARKFLVGIYITMLLISTWFAYVHVANYAYRNTREIDTQSIAEEIIGEIITETQNYVAYERNKARDSIIVNLQQLQRGIAVRSFTAHNVAVPTPPPGIQRELPIWNSVAGALEAGGCRHQPVSVPQERHAVFGNSDVRRRHNAYYDARHQVRTLLEEIYHIETYLHTLSTSSVNDSDTVMRLSRVRSNLERLQREINTVNNHISFLRIDEFNAWQGNVGSGWFDNDIRPAIRSYITSEIAVLEVATHEYAIVETWLREIHEFQVRTDDPLWSHFDVLMAHMAEGQGNLNTNMPVNQYGSSGAGNPNGLDGYIISLLTYVDYFIRNQILEDEDDLLTPQLFRENLDAFINTNDIYTRLEAHRQSMSEINFDINTDTYDQWHQDWRTLIDDLSSTLNSFRVDESSDFNAQSHVVRLIQLYRRRFTEINEMERAALHFVQAPRFSAVVSALFAVFLDVAPLGMGFAISAKTKIES